MRFLHRQISRTCISEQCNFILLGRSQSKQISHTDTQLALVLSFLNWGSHLRAFLESPRDRRSLMSEKKMRIATVLDMQPFSRIFWPWPKWTTRLEPPLPLCYLGAQEWASREWHRGWHKSYRTMPMLSWPLLFLRKTFCSKRPRPPSIPANSLIKQTLLGGF